MQAQVVELAHGPTKYIPASPHCGLPGLGLDVQTLSDRWQSFIDEASLVVAHAATGPVYELEIVIERDRKDVSDFMCSRRIAFSS